MPTRTETAFTRMVAKVADRLALHAWLVRGADQALGYDQPAPVPASADATHISVRVFPETNSDGPPQQGAQNDGLEEIAGVRRPETVFRLVAADLATAPTIDDRIVLLDGKNYQVLRVRHDGHAADQRIAWVVTVRTLEPTLTA